MRPRKYHVELTETERKELNDLTNKGKVSAIKIKHAQILLKLDECTEEKPWAVADISKAFNISERTVCSIAKRFVEDGLECALERKKQLNRHHKITGDVEAKIIAIACSEAPEGYNRWTLQMIADKLVELKVIDSISSAAVGTALKKNELKPWLIKEWCIPKPGAEFVAAMEDILNVYQNPYNEMRPVVCFDETNRQLIEESRPSLPVQSGEVKKIDYEYRRNGVVDLFMMFEPLAGQRHVAVTDSRKRADFAHCIKLLVDEYYPKCEKIVLVMDNLNTHSTASLYAAFPPAEARRLADKLEIHYTPKHASWLNMAEIEIGVMSRQCLSEYLPTKDKIELFVSKWCFERNKKLCKVNWQFSTSDARIKLKRLYPIIE